MSSAARYAIYFIPPADSELYRFGRSVLAYDCYTGQDVSPNDRVDLREGDWARLVQEPRRYGFHATLKAPFHLKEGCTEPQLVSAVERFAGLGHATIQIEPEVRMLSGFVAVVPRQRSAPLDLLANQCTVVFDAFRAPMSAQERARRLAPGLTPSQIENLDRWGYPYLFGDFRFHMTLTGNVPGERRDIVLARLEREFESACGGRPLSIDSITLLKQDSGEGCFYVLSQHALACKAAG